MAAWRCERPLPPFLRPRRRRAPATAASALSETATRAAAARVHWYSTATNGPCRLPSRDGAGARRTARPPSSDLWVSRELGYHSEITAPRHRQYPLVPVARSGPRRDSLPITGRAAVGRVGHGATHSFAHVLGPGRGAALGDGRVSWWLDGRRGSEGLATRRDQACRSTAAATHRRQPDDAAIADKAAAQRRGRGASAQSRRSCTARPIRAGRPRRARRQARHAGLGRGRPGESGPEPGLTRRAE